MMSGQLARLFLRGSLMNETAQLLTRSEVEQVDALVRDVWSDHNLQGPKMEFCMALSRSIGNEYKDLEAGQQEIRITFWKAALLILFHESKQCTKCNKHYITTKSKADNCTICGSKLIVKWTPKPQIALDPIKRKKFFQAVMFNYLRQIFRENKPPSNTEIRTESGDAPDVAVKLIIKILDKTIYQIEELTDSHDYITCETGLLPLKTIKHIVELKNDFEQHGVQISLDWHGINIVSLLEIPKDISCKIADKTYTKFVSLDSNKNDDNESGSFRDACEYKTITRNTVQPDYGETIDIIKSRLSNDARKLLDLILDVPPDYIERFGTTKLHKSHLAEYLGKDPKEITDLKENIKRHCLAMNIGVD